MTIRSFLALDEWQHPTDIPESHTYAVFQWNLSSVSRVTWTKIESSSSVQCLTLLEPIYTLPVFVSTYIRNYRTSSCKRRGYAFLKFRRCISGLYDREDYVRVMRESQGDIKRPMRHNGRKSLIGIIESITKYLRSLSSHLRSFVV